MILRRTVPRRTLTGGLDTGRTLGPLPPTEIVAAPGPVEYAGTGKGWAAGGHHKQGQVTLAMAESTCSKCGGPIILWPSRNSSRRRQDESAGWAHCRARDDDHLARPRKET